MFKLQQKHYLTCSFQGMLHYTILHATYLAAMQQNYETKSKKNCLRYRFPCFHRVNTEKEYYYVWEIEELMLVFLVPFFLDFALKGILATLSVISFNLNVHHLKSVSHEF